LRGSGVENGGRLLPANGGVTLATGTQFSWRTIGERQGNSDYYSVEYTVTKPGGQPVVIGAAADVIKYKDDAASPLSHDETVDLMVKLKASSTLAPS
jgi:hypothetical protein